MPDVSSADTSAKECNSSNPEIDGGDVESGLAGQATLLPCGTVVEMESGRWDRELTLAQPWRCHTLKGLSQDCIAHWTDSNEAEFRDGMYHSGFKWRVLHHVFPLVRSLSDGAGRSLPNHAGRADLSFPVAAALDADSRTTHGATRGGAGS